MEKPDSFKEQGEVNDIGSQRFEIHLMREAVECTIILVKKNE
ncbi:MAG: hypothetical protein ACHQ03_02400 [Candidatus Bathyarchaeia archaeon]